MAIWHLELLFRTCVRRGGMANAVNELQGINRGLQLLKRVDFDNEIEGVTEIPGLGLAVFGDDSGVSVLQLMSYLTSSGESSDPQRIPEKISHLQYISLLKMFIATYDGHNLALFNKGFDLIHSISLIGDEITCLDCNEEEFELYICTKQKKLLMWKLNYTLASPLSPGKEFRLFQDGQACHVKFYSDSNLLVVSTLTSIYIVNTVTSELQHAYLNADTSITSAVLSPAKHEYLIIGSETGTIKMLDNIQHSYIDSLCGHTTVVTGLAVHPVSPAIVSCSLDQTIRVWNYESMIQIYCMHCESPLLGMCTDHPRITCYSQHQIDVWNIGRLETHFAKISNPCIVKMQRLDATSHERVQYLASRILVVAKDGETRLLSPVTGRTITILFPMFSQPIVKDIICSQKDQLIFMLLKSYTVLVFDTKHNPCAARELWTFTIQEHRITCFAICHTKLSTGKVHALVFGGQTDGNITLLYSTDGVLNMTSNCQAHNGNISTLVSSNDILYPKTKSHMLASYGQDRCLRIWTLSVLEPSHNISLSLLICVTQMEETPEKLLLTKGTVCFVLEKVQLIMLKLPEKQVTKSASSCRTSISKESHWHKTPITALVGCSALGLAITSSYDGILKTWKLCSNTLMSTLNVGAAISCIAIANSRMDLLISTRNIITLVPSHHYLPNTLNINVEKRFRVDALERSIPFNKESEFWYGTGRVRTLPLNQLFRLHYIMKHNVGLRNFPSEKLRQSWKLMPPAYIKTFEKIDVLSKRYPVLLEQKVKLDLALSHLHKFSTTESVRCYSAALLRRFCAKRKPDPEGLVSFDSTDLAVDPFAPSQNFEVVDDIRKPQESQLKHPPIDGFLPNSIYRQIRFGNSAIKKFVASVQESTKKRSRVKLERPLYNQRRTKRRLKRSQKQTKRWENDTETTQPETLVSPHRSQSRLSSSISETKVAAISESSLYTVSTSRRLLALTEEEESMLMFLLQGNDQELQLPPYKRTPRGSPESETKSYNVGSGHSTAASDHSDYMDRQHAVRYRKSSSGRQVRFREDYEYESGQRSSEVFQDATVLQPPTEAAQGKGPDIHRLYEGLMEKLNQSDPADEKYTNVLGILHKLKKNNLLTEEEKRNIGSPINFFLDVMSRQEAERRLSSGTTVASEDSATSITPAQERKTRRYSFTTLPDFEVDREKSATIRERSATNSQVSLPPIVSMEDENQATENKVLQKQKLQKKHQSRSKYPHIPPPPPPPPPLYLPPLERRWELLEVRRQLHRENFAAQRQQQHCMPVYFKPGLNMEAVTVSSIAVQTHAIPAKRKEREHGLSPPRGSIPNYTWLENRRYQNIARGLNLTGMDLVRVFMNYPSAIQSSPEITQWLVKRKEEHIHSELRQVPLKQPTSQTKKFINSCIVGSNLSDKYREHSIIYEWNDIYQANSHMYAAKN